MKSSTAVMYSLFIVLLLCTLPILSDASADDDSLFKDGVDVEYSNGYVYVSGELKNVQSGAILLISISSPSGESVAESFVVDISDRMINEKFNTKILPVGDSYKISFSYILPAASPIYDSALFNVTESQTEITPPEKIILSDHDVTLTLGDSKNNRIKLEYTLEPSDAQGNITWTSSDPNVATVDSNGVVTAVSSGTTHITATIGSVSDRCIVRVNSSSGSSNGSMTLSHAQISMHNNGKGITLSAELEGVSITDLLWETSNDEIVSFLEGTSFKSSISGKKSVTLIGVGVGTATIELSSSNARTVSCTVTVTEAPTDTNDEWYYFFIQFREDSDKSNYLTQGDRETGFWLAGYAANAAAALEKACKDSDIEISLVTTGALRGWLGSFFNLRDVQQENGDWLYWSQYEWSGSYFSLNGKWNYNNSSLGYYDKGGTFALIRQITSVDGASTDISVTAADVPEEMRHTSGSSSTVTENPDGSTTTTTENPDGTTTVVTEKKPETINNQDGSKTTKVEKTEEVKDSDGKTQSVKEEIVLETVKTDGSTLKETDSVLKDAEGKTVEESTAVEIKDSTGSVATQAEIKKDSQGNKQAESTTTVKAGSEISEETIIKAAEQLEEVKKKAEEKETELSAVLEIDAKTNSTAESSSVTLPVSSLETVAETVTEVKISTDVGDVNLPADVLSSISSESGEKIVLEISRVDKEELNSLQQERVKDSLVIDVNLKLDGSKISSLGGEVRISVPYELNENEDSSKIKVFYLDDDGNITEMKTDYDSETKTVSFYTNHLSYYFISADAEADPDPVDPVNPEPEKKNDSNIWIYAAAVAAVILIAALVIFYLHRQNKL